MAKGPSLADVLAAPDDLDLRMVWADALQANGDPRGELAALQLAKTRTYEGWVREAELIAEHGDDWAKPLGHYFSSYVFEGGVLAGGRPAYGFAPDPDNVKGVPGASFTEPAWNAITTISELHYGQRVLDAKHVPIRRLRQVWETEALELLAKYASRPLKQIVELEVRPQGDGEAATKLLGTCRALPNLRTLTIHGPRPHAVEALTGSSVLERIERLGIEDVGEYARAEGLIAAAIASKGALREVMIRFADRNDYGWQVTLHREAPGPFTQIVAWWRKPEVARAPKELAGDCIRILNLIDRSKVRSLSIETGKPMRFPSDAMRTLSAQLAEMPLEHCVVPWKTTPLKAPSTGEQRWQVELGRCDALARIGGAWKAFGPELGVAWDAMSADNRGTPALGKDPVASLKKRAKAKLQNKLSLVRSGSRDAIHFSRHGWVTGTFTSALPPPELATWFASAVSTLEPNGIATCGLAEQSDDINAFDLESYGAADAGWIVALPPATSKGLTAKLLAKLGAIPVESPARVVFTIGDDPSKVDNKRAREFAAELVEILDELRAAKAPKWFAPAVRKAMAPIAKRLKLTKTSDHPLRLVWSRGKRYIRVRLDHSDGRIEINSSSFQGGGTEVRNAKDVATAIAESSHHLV